MSKDLQRKAIEAGIIPTGAVRLLKMWRSLPEDLPEEEQEEKTQQELLELVDEIAELLEADQEIPEMRETDLDLDKCWESATVHMLTYRLGMQNLQVSLPVAKNRQGEFIFKWLDSRTEIMVRVGAQITDVKRNVYEITQVTMRYVEDRLRYLVCEVQEVPEHAVVRGVPELSSGY